MKGRVLVLDILEEIKKYAESDKELVAVKSLDESITYKELHEFSDKLAYYLEENYKDNKSPIVVYGHKSPFMIVCFLACVKSKREYCPIDISMPLARVKTIIDMVNPPVILAVEELSNEFGKILELSKIKNIIKETDKKINPNNYVKDNDIFYIIFTSGSTGKPKGVQITKENLNNYLNWSVNLGSKAEEKRNKRFLNQAPFSFDLSVMDLYTSLATGGTLYTMSKAIQNDYSKLMEFLIETNPNIWVSTPSFADVCLLDKKFNGENIPSLKLFLFCGETLPKNTAKNLMERFKNAKVINTYGPTESTVAVTDILVTEELLKEEGALPVGKAKEGSFIEIWDENGNILKENEKGEIIIIGNTVSAGYFNSPEITKKSFFTLERDGKKYKGYHTGDSGYIKSGQLYYCGRMDLQIKLHGYRIEIEDIENNILKLPEITSTVVIPNVKDGKVKSLTAFVSTEEHLENTLANSKMIKTKLKEHIPDYMVPKKIVFIDKIPMTANGKADRKFLGGLL